MGKRRKYFTDEQRAAAQRAAVKRYYTRHREEVKARIAAWKEKNREEVNAKMRGWYEKNHERIRAYKKAYYQRNKAKIKAVRLKDAKPGDEITFRRGYSHVIMPRRLVGVSIVEGWRLPEAEREFFGPCNDVKFYKIDFK